MQFDPPGCYMKIWLQGLNQSQDDERNYSYAPNFSNVSEFKSTAISGYVAQMSCLSFICCSINFERQRKFV